MNILLASTQVPDSISATGALTWVKGFLLLAVSVILVYLTIKALMSHGKEGDIKGSISMMGATLICLMPIAVGASVAVLTGYGDAMLGLVMNIIS